MTQKEIDHKRLSLVAQHPTSKLEVVALVLLTIAVLAVAIFLEYLGHSSGIIGLACVFPAACVTMLRFFYLEPLTSEIRHLREEIDTLKEEKVEIN